MDKDAMVRSRMERFVHWKMISLFLGGALLGALVGYGISALVHQDPVPTFLPIFLMSSLSAWAMLIYAIHRYAGPDFEIEFIRRAREKGE